jgi:predicted AlkP superfamily phosphohydrolase/phosphomutase
MPMTYPPKKVNGIMISGLGTPMDSEKFTYPLNIYKEINEKVGTYVKDIFWANYDENNIDKLIADIKSMTLNHFKIASYLLEKENWDIFSIIFVGPDRLQHCLWRYIDVDGQKKMSKREQAISDSIIDYYSLLDTLIGKLISQSDNETDILFLSDHGFGPLYKRINLNNWLIQNNYLTLFDNSKTKSTFFINTIKKLLKEIGFDKKRLQYFINKYGIKVDLYKQLEKSSSIIGNINWSKTKAFSYSCNSIFINLKDRERAGIVQNGKEYEELCEEIIKKLCSIKDPETGGLIVRRVSRKEEVYTGDFLKSAPDLLITEYDEKYWFGYWGKTKMYLDKNRLDIFEKDSWHSGQHTLQGLYIAYGNDFKKSYRFDYANIVDLFPTILYLLELPIPEDIDGNVLTEIIKHESLSKNIVKVKEFVKNDTESYQLTENERDEIRRQLKGLGYLG